MGRLYLIDSPDVALTAGTARSVLVATASSSRGITPAQVKISCDAASTGLLKIEFLVGTLTGGTTGTAPNVGRMNADAYLDAPLFAASSYSAEPTYAKHADNGALAIETTVTPLPLGPFLYELPLGREYYCPASNVFVVRLTSTTVSPNAYVTLAVEE